MLRVPEISACGRSDNEELACHLEDPGLFPGLGRSPGGGHGTTLQYPCLDNSMDRGVWRATVPKVVKSQT